MQEPRPERTLYEIASSFFAVVVIAFAIAGMIVAGLGDGALSGSFAICSAFLMLGLGRLYLGLRASGQANSRDEAVPPQQRPRSVPQRPGDKSRRPPTRRRP